MSRALAGALGIGASRLGKAVGSVQAATLSFLVGTVALALLAAGVLLVVLR